MYFNQQIEKYVLGNMIFFYDSTEILNIFTDLDESDFENINHQMIFRAGKELVQENKPCDIISIHSWIEVNKMSGSCPIGFLKEITGFGSTSTAIPGLIEQMKDLRKRRTLRQYACNIQNALVDSKTSEQAIEVAKEFPALDDGSKQMYTTRELIHNGVQRMIERKKSGKLKGVQTGFPDIDIMTGGLQKKEMSIVGARPSIGKSVFAFDISKNVAKQGKRAVFFSLEMSEEMIIDRLFASEFMVQATRIKIPALLDKEDQKKMQQSKIEEEFDSLHICADPNIDLAGIRAKCKEIIFKYGPIDLVVVDYLQYMTGTGKDTRDIVEKNSAGLKRLASDLDVHMMCISSLNRSSEMRSDKKPTMGDLRETGKIEFDADVIILLHRDTKAENIEDRRLTEVIFDKQRNGKTGTIKLYFMDEFVTFKSLERR